jgi:hypothetical protein
MDSMKNYLSSFVEVNGALSDVFSVPLGCVQGSVLGPKLFNLYTRDVPSHLVNGAFITTYADDSDVIISKPKEGTLSLIS